MVVQSSGRRARRDRRDRGFTLVESMVALGVLAIIATAAAAMLIHALGVTANDRQRVRAASVAAQEVERIRGLMQSNPSGIVSDTSRTVATLSPTQFTITSDVADTGTSYHLVDSGEWSSPDAYESLRLTVTATWTNMDGVKPVVNSSILTINGTGGNGSGGSTAVSVTPVPVSPDPVVTISPSCDLRRSTIGFSVNSQTTMLGVPMLTPLASGTVSAVPASGNPCTTTIPLTLQSGIVTGTLPYGNWTITASMNNLAGNSNSMSLAVNAGATNGGFLNIVDTSSCANTGLVAVTVQSKNLIAGLFNLLSTATVTATRAATSTCAATSTTFPISLGLGGGNLSYGDWTFNVQTSMGTASATKTINSGVSLPVVLTVNDSSCPTGPVTVTLSTSTTSNSTPVGYGGTVIATPGSNNCSSAAKQLVMTSGSVSANLSYGDWTFTAGPSTKTSNVSSADTTSVAMQNVVFNCATTAHVNVPLADTTSLLGTYKVRATLRNGCSGTSTQDTTFLAVLGLLGSGTFDLKPGVYDFTLVSPSSRSIDLTASDPVSSVMASGTTSLKIVLH